MCLRSYLFTYILGNDISTVGGAIATGVTATASAVTFGQVFFYINAQIRQIPT